MRIAIVGCGQLSRMLALAGIPLGIKFSFVQDDLAQVLDCVEGLGVIAPAPAKLAETETYVRADIEQLYQVLGKPDCITVEKEQVDITLLKALSEFCPIYPNMKAIRACQHRGEEKNLLASLKIPTSPYFHNISAIDAVKALGLPAVVKSCTEGYDGKNQWVLKTVEDAAHFDTLNIQDYIVEAFVAFDKEISLVSVRNKQGDIKHYSLTDNIHVKGMLTNSIAPAINLSDKVTVLAQDYMERLMNDLDYVGVMAMECFVLGEELMINELAPRVHNSGHWTQLGSLTCQFENHIRALAGLSLGSTQQIAVTGMLNLVGVELPAFETIEENAKLHWYNKSVRPNRKLGHVNFIGEDRAVIAQQMAKFGGA